MEETAFVLMECPVCHIRYAVVIHPASGVIAGMVWAMWEAKWLAEAKREGFQPNPWIVAAPTPVCVEPTCTTALSDGVQAFLSESGDWIVIESPVDEFKVMLQ